MNWLDDLLGKQLQDDGTNLPQRKILNIIGATIADNPVTGATDLNIPSGSVGSYGAKMSVTAKSNGGVTSYPSLAAQAVGLSTFVRTAAADHDSIRFPVTADGIITTSDGLQGRITNNTVYIIDLYPPSGESIAVDGAALLANTPIEVPPGGTVLWMLDTDGTFACVGL